MVQLLHIDSQDHTRAEAVERTTMTVRRLTEAGHLERWIIEHPEVLGDDLMVVSSQFQSWESEVDSARDRLDILALSSSGESVVIELKRDGDRNVHLQALTYAALVSGFTRESLAQAHATWLTRRGEGEVTFEEARRRLEDHVDGEWTDEVLALPRVLLVAESFPAQVITTVQWLANVTTALVVEAHEYHLFQRGDDVVVAFQRLFPVAEVKDRVLRPSSVIERAGVSEQIVQNQRRARSTVIISESGTISEGEPVTLDLAGLVRPAVVEQVEKWMAADPVRSRVSWTNDSIRPLRWQGSADEEVEAWSPTRLRNEIFSRAGVESGTFSAADAWCLGVRSLYNVADDIIAERQAGADTDD